MRNGEVFKPDPFSPQVASVRLVPEKEKESKGQKKTDSSPPTFKTQDVVVRKGDGKDVSFSLDVAFSRDQQAYGLMFRKTLEEGRGMIFLYLPPQKVSFWMKNTFIPLDMLFFGSDRRIFKIVKNAKTEDETPIPSEEPVLGVIEIKGGEADRLGIAVGDSVL